MQIATTSASALAAAQAIAGYPAEQRDAALFLLVAVVWWIGTYAIFSGMALTALALRLRRWVARQTE